MSAEFALKAIADTPWTCRAADAFNARAGCSLSGTDDV